MKRALPFALIGLMLSQSSLALDGSPKNKIFVGYGAWSRTWLDDRASTSIGNFFFGNTALGNSSNTLYSNGIRQLGYSYRFTDHWEATVSTTHEHFQQIGDLDATMLGFRKVYSLSPARDFYFGLQAGPATLKYDSGASADKSTAWQVDMGMQFFKGSVFGYVNLGLGDAGTFATGVGTRF